MMDSAGKRRKPTRNANFWFARRFVSFTGVGSDSKPPICSVPDQDLSVRFREPGIGSTNFGAGSLQAMPLCAHSKETDPARELEMN